MFKNLSTSLEINFSSKPSLKDTFYHFDLEMPPKGRKTWICGSQN